MSNITFKEAVEEFEDAVRDSALMCPSDDCVRVTEVLWEAKARLLAFDPAAARRDYSSLYEYADAHAHEFEVPIATTATRPPMSDLARCIFDMANATNRAIAASLRRDA